MDYVELLTCPVCGKRFCVWDKEIYQWKFKEDLFCSYTCMRTVEKKYLSAEKIFQESGFEKPKLPEQYRNVYFDLMRLRKLSRLVNCINMIKSRYDLCEDDSKKLYKLYRKTLYSMRKIRCKYVYGVEKLDKQQYDLLILYVVNFTDAEDISETLGLEIGEINKIFTSVMEILKENISDQTKRNRWDFVKC